MRQRNRFEKQGNKHLAVKDNPMAPSKIIDVHSHIYPAGCFTEVLKDRADFKLIDNPRGQSLIYRGTHVMSMPTEQDDLTKAPGVHG